MRELRLIDRIGRGLASIPRWWPVDEQRLEEAYIAGQLFVKDEEDGVRCPDPWELGEVHHRRFGIPVPSLPPLDAVIDATAAAEFYFQIDPSPRLTHPRDLPTLAPPFRTFWIEMKTPRVININGKLVPSPAYWNEFGMLCQSESTADGWTSWFWFAVQSAKIGRVGTATRDWLYAKTTFPWWGIVLDLDHQGRCVRATHDEDLLCPDLPREDGVLLDNGDEIEGDPFFGGNLRGCEPDAEDFDARRADLDECLRKDTVVGLAQASALLFAISLMHVKGASLSEGTINHKLSRAGERRGYPPILRYHVLNVEPASRSLIKNAVAETGSVERGLHQVRGHFKDYRESGLFGKHKGIFWWGQAIRGDASVALIDKDYRVKAPSEK